MAVAKGSHSWTRNEAWQQLTVTADKGSMFVQVIISPDSEMPFQAFAERTNKTSLPRWPEPPDGKDRRSFRWRAAAALLSAERRGYVLLCQGNTVSGVRLGFIETGCASARKGASQWSEAGWEGLGSCCGSDPEAVWTWRDLRWFLVRMGSFARFLA